MGGGPHGLNPKQMKFVEEFLKTGNASQSALAAGYALGNMGTKLLNHNAGVMAAVEAARAKCVENAAYGLKESVAELNQKIERAEQAEQYSAVAKMMELKFKLHGLLVERHDIRQAGFHINIIRRYREGENPPSELPDPDEIERLNAEKRTYEATARAAPGGNTRDEEDIWR